MAANQFDQFTAPAGNPFDQFDPGAKPKPAGFLRSVADLGIEAVSGMARGVKATADAFGADNVVSQGADTVDKFARDYLSAASKADDKRVAEIMAAAQDAGVWEQVKAAAEAFTVKPAGFVMNALGTSVPTIAATMIPGVGQAGAAARLGMLGSMGAAQGAGAVKGSIYEAVKAKQIKAGMTEAEAEAAAVKAQEYGGENTANIIGGAALGGAATATGVQPVIAKMLQRSEQVAAEVGKRGMIDRALNPEGLLARTGMGALKEAPLEAAQGGQEQYASNIALQNEGFDTPTFRGVAGSAALEGLASAGPGAAFGALDKPTVRNDKPGAADVLGATSVDEAINKSLAVLALPAPSSGVADELVDGVLALPGPAKKAEPPILRALPAPDGGVVYMADADGNLAPQPASARAEAVNRAAEADIAATQRRLAEQQQQTDLGMTPGLRKAQATREESNLQREPIPVGEATEVLPTGEVEEFDVIPAGEAAEFEVLPVGEILDGDLMAKDGAPFVSKTGAQARAFASGGGRVVPIPDHFGAGQPGYVVRPLMPARPNNTRGTDARDLPRSGNVNQPDVSGTAPVAAGPTDGAGDQRGRGIGTVGRVADDGRTGAVDAGLPATAGGGNANQVAGSATGNARPDALSGNGFIPAPNGYKVRVSRHQRGSNALDPEGDIGAFTYEVRKGDSDPNPLTMVVRKDGKLVPATTVLTDNKSNGTAWVPQSEESARTVADLLAERAKTAVGSPERKAVDAKIVEAVEADQAGPTGGAAAPGIAPTLTEGQSVTLKGESYTVTSVNASAVKLQGADGITKMVATNSKTFGQIEHEGLPPKAAKTAEESIRTAVDAVPGRVVGSWYPVTVSHNGREQHFLSNVKRVISDGKGPSAVSLAQIKQGRMLAGEPLRPLFYGYRLTRDNKLVEEGIPREASEAEIKRWESSFGAKPAQEPDAQQAPAPRTEAPAPTAAPATEAPAAGTGRSAGVEADGLEAAPNAAAPASTQAPETSGAPVAAAPSEADDYLTQLFGTPAEQAVAQERFTAGEAQRKQDTERIRDAIGAEKKRAQAEYDNWSSRTYKRNKTQVDLQGDGPSNQGSMSIGAINESRRRNAMEALTQELKALDKLGQAVATDSGAEQFMGAMRALLDRATKIATDGNGLFKTADEQFQYMLLDDLKVRGPGGKGNVTSNGLSKAVLAAIKPGAAAPALTAKAQAVKETLAAKKGAEPPKRTEARGKAKHPKTVAGSSVLAMVSQSLGGLDPRRPESVEVPAGRQSAAEDVERRPQGPSRQADAGRAQGNQPAGPAGSEAEGLTLSLGASAVLARESLELPATKRQQDSPWGEHATGRYIITVQQFTGGPGSAVYAVHSSRSGGMVATYTAEMPGQALEAGEFRKLNEAAKSLFDRVQRANEDGLLTAQTADDLKAKTEREAAGAAAERAKKAADQERLRREAEQRDNRARADQTVDDFQLGQSAEQQMSGMGDLFAAAPAPAATPAITPDQAANMRRGDIVRDSSGTEFYAWSARFGRIDVMPLKDGKPVVNNASAIRFALDDATKAANPEYRTDPLYLVRSAPAEAEPATQAAAILDAAAEPPKGKERLDVLKDVKAGAITPEEVASAYPAAEQATPAAPMNTEDSGAELTYNRRNRIKSGIKWADIASKNDALKVKEAVKQNVYPRPDYQALVDGGMQPLVAHLVKQAYDAIAAKPNTRGAPTDADLQTYIVGVNRVMAGVLAWANDPVSLSKWATREARFAGAMLGKSVNLSELAPGGGKSMMETVYPDGWKGNQAEVIVLGGNKLLGALQPSYDEAKRAGKAVDAGWPASQEAWERRGIKIIHAEKIDVSYYEGKRSRTEQPYVSISYKVGQTRLMDQLIDSAESKDDPKVQAAVAAELEANQGMFIVMNKARRIVGKQETEEAAKDVARELTKREGKESGPDDSGIDVAMARREGPPRRLDGENVSSDQLKDAFGFKGVNFGNWMKGDTPALRAERQAHLNHAYDSFADLADLFGVPSKAMSLNGMLGLAIGAQGNGKYAAHFVPGVNEINLTRASGAGSLAHEWGHALDHYFAEQAGFAKRGEPFLTEHTTSVVRKVVVENGRERMVVDTDAQRIRPEIVERFKAIVQAMNKKPETVEQFNARQQRAKEIAKSNMNSWLKSIRRDYMKAGVDEAALDAIATRILALDVGAGKIMVSPTLAVHPVVDELRALYRKKAGRVPPIDQIKGLQSNLDYYAYAMSEKPGAVDHVPQQVSTDYANAAASLDKEKGGKRYWSTNLEKFARAFDAFVSDELEAKAAKNTYLSHAGRTGETVPMGDERKTINAAIKALVGEIQTREDDAGNVALFSRAPSRSVELEAADAVGREFWRKIDNGESFTDQEVLDALALNRRGPRRDAEDLAVPPGMRATGESVVRWSGEIAGFDGYRTSAAWDGDGFTVFVVPEELAANADLTDPDQARGKAIISYVLTPAADGRHEFSVNDVQQNSEAEQALRERGQLLSAGTPGKPYRRVNIGHTANKALTQEVVRRLALNIGKTPTPYYPQRDTGARAGQANSGRDFTAEDVRDKFSRPPGSRAGIPFADAEAVADAIRAAYPTGPQIVVLEDVRKAPESLFDQIRAVQAMNSVEGAYYKGRIYLFPQNVADIERLMFVGAHHEIRHAGLDALFGKRKNALMLSLFLSNPKLADAARKKMVELNTDSKVLATEEALADMPLEDMAKLNGWNKIVAAVRQWLRGLADRLRRNHQKLAAMIQPDQWTDNDIAALIQRAEDISRGGTVPARPGGAVFSDQNSPDWYSALADQVGKASMNAGPASAWQSAIKNWVSTGKAKADEVEWSGLAEWLGLQQGKVTRQQVADYLQGNGVQVTETVLGSGAGPASFMTTSGDRMEYTSAAEANAEREKEIEWANNSASVSEGTWRGARTITVRLDTGGDSPFSVAEQEDGTWEGEDGDGHTLEFDDYDDALSAAEEAAQNVRDYWLDKIGEVEASEQDNTKYANYTLPGGTNYREVLLTLPAKPIKMQATPEQRAYFDFMDGLTAKYGAEWRSKAPIDDRLKVAELESAARDSRPRDAANPDGIGSLKQDQANYRSSHWDQPNILAHIRVNDRTDADGARVLFVEEVQSDWQASNRKALNELAKPQSVRELAQKVFGRKMASVMPLDGVNAGVLLALEYDQVRRAVIASLPVNVVDNLIGGQGSADQLFSNPDMVVAGLSSDHLQVVADGLLGAALRVGAGLRAKLANASNAGRDVELLPALNASQLNPRVVVGLLAPASLNHVGLPRGASGGDVAALGAERLLASGENAGRASERASTVGADGSGNGRQVAGSAAVPAAVGMTGADAKNGPASLAGLLDWHTKIVRQGGVSQQGQYMPGPFVGKTEAFVALALKRVVKMAVDGGYDKVAFVTGSQSADRYDLSKQISAIRYGTNPGSDTYNIRAYLPNGGGIALDEKRVTLQRIEGLVGKEIAKKIAAGEGDNRLSIMRESGGDLDRELSGLDLKVGGEGMKAFYDRIVPAVTKDVLRKLGGGAMETVDLGADVPGRVQDRDNPDYKPLMQPAFTITQQMRDKARGGMPLFSRASQAPASSEPARFSRAGTAKVTAQDLLKANGGVFGRAGETKQDRVRAVVDGSRPFWLGALTRDQIADMYGDELPPVREYDNLTRAMENERQGAAQKADELYEEWSKIDAEANDRLARLMLDATVAQVHPDRATLPAKATEEQKQAHSRLRVQFNLLPKDAQAMYGKVRDFHANTLKDLRAALEGRIARLIENGSERAVALAEIRARFDQYMQGGPYFPLHRFGDFLVVAERAKDGERVVAAYENAGEQQAAARALEADGFAVKLTMAKAYTRSMDGSAGKFIGDVLTAIDKMDLREANINGTPTSMKAQLLDDLNQLFIKALPDLSYRKHFTHRKGTAGFSADVMRGFASSAFHAAGHIARLNHGDKMTFALDDAYQQIKLAPEGDFTKAGQVLNEMALRHEAALNPNVSPLSALATQVGFVMYLGLSPAAGLINMMQVPMVALPYIGARYGFAKATAAMGRAYTDIMGAKPNAKNGFNAAQSPKLSADERRAISTLQDEGVIDLTQAHDLAAATTRDVGNQARNKASFAIARAMRIVGWTFHVPEVMNRQVTALMAYRLEMAKSGNEGKAMDAAREAIKRSQFDYASSNRARYMQGDIARVVTQFRQFSQNMTYFLGRSAYQALKGEDPEVRRIARQQLVATFLVTGAMAGSLGLPGLGFFAGLVEALVNAMGDDDDEPWDWKTAYRNMLADNFGKEWGEVMARGVPRALMPAWDISNRVSLGDLWWRDNSREGDSPREAFANDMSNILGPTAGTLLGWYTASDHMARGDYGKAVESVVPKFIRDPLKAWRESQDGITSYNGEQLLEPTSAEVAGRFLGFAPSRASEMYEGRSAVMGIKTALEDRRQRLVSQMAKARIDGDTETVAELQQRIRAWNTDNPKMAITGATIVRSVLNRRRNTANTEQGITLPDSKDFLRDRARFAEVD